MKFALNQRTVPELDFEAFLDLAVELGCIGVEPRNDLGRPVFDGLTPQHAGSIAQSKGLRLVGLSEVYPFNDWNKDREKAVAEIISTAYDCGAETISLIPRVDGLETEDGLRQKKLREVLEKVLPLLQQARVTGLIEPIGFSTSSLKYKAEAVAAIKDLNASEHLGVVHDTFQHSLAAETEVFPAYTRIVHISGITADSEQLVDEQDKHRVLIDESDRVGNVEQINDLLNGHYDGVFSFECTSPVVQKLSDPATAIKNSFNFLETQIKH